MRRLGVLVLTIVLAALPSGEAAVPLIQHGFELDEPFLASHPALRRDCGARSQGDCSLSYSAIEAGEATYAIPLLAGARPGTIGPSFTSRIEFDVLVASQDGATKAGVDFHVTSGALRIEFVRGTQGTSAVATFNGVGGELCSGWSAGAWIHVRAFVGALTAAIDVSGCGAGSVPSSLGLPLEVRIWFDAPAAGPDTIHVDAVTAQAL